MTRRRSWLMALLAALGIGGWWWWDTTPPPPPSTTTTVAPNSTTTSTVSANTLPSERSLTWGLVQGDLQRTGLATIEGPPAAAVRWTLSMSAWGSPPLIDGSIVYVADDSGKVYSLDADTGMARWSTALAPPDRPDGYSTTEIADMQGDGRFFTPHFTHGGAIGADGTLYLASTFHSRLDDPRAETWYALRRELLGLYALSPDGRQRWFLSTGKDAAGALLVLGDGTILYRTVGALSAVSPRGRETWRTQLDGDVQWSSPAVSPDGQTIYVVGNSLVALRRDGSVRWVVGEPVTAHAAHPTVAEDGTIFFGSASDLWAVAPTGQVRWRRSIGWTESSPALLPDGTVVIGTAREESGTSRLHAVDPATGQDRWAFAFPDRGTDQSPVVGADGTVYVATDGGWLYALQAPGVVRWRLDLGRAMIPNYGMLVAEADSSPALGADGTLYVAHSGGPKLPTQAFLLYAIR